jgi:hypothetical protein
MAAGELKVVALSDLGPLGSREGPPASYVWVMPGFAPQLLAWLIILGLLALKTNRLAAAWLIWLPLGCVMAFTLAPPLLPSGADFFLDVIIALAIGYAAIWLLASQLRRQHGFLTFLCVLLALVVSSLLAFAFRLGADGAALETLPIGFLVAIGALVTSVALSLDGLICRHRYRPAGLYLWLFLLLVAIWLLVAAPFFVIALISSGGRIAGSEFFIPVLVVAIVHFATLLPFLILSSASTFYRERLKALLHVKPEVPPPLAAPPPDIGLKT